MADQITVTPVLSGAKKPAPAAAAVAVPPVVPGQEPTQMSGGAGGTATAIAPEGLPNQGTDAAAESGGTGGAELPKAERFALLAKKEKALQSKRSALAQQQSEIARRGKELEERESAFAAARAKALSDPDAYLKAAGLSYDDLVQYKISGAPTEGMSKRAIEQRLADFEASQKSAAEQSASEQKKALLEEQEQMVARFERDVIGQVKAAAEKYELVNLQNKQDLVVDVIRAYHSSHGEILPVERAAQLVEDQLREEVELAVEKSKSLSSKYAKRVTAPVATSPGQPPKSVSLSNAQTSSSAPKRALSEEERVRRAMAVKIQR
ncbi:MAG: hypothetical protein EPO08_21385 [Rhodospirillaceae bacterium]|nr:MAG: hypothetical protein EPO08_21385 [Rhodospirillaceae bacterium]